MAMPATTRRRLRPRTRFRTWVVVAPSAIRTPISRVRCATP
jgi:hypothetical protein